MKKAILSFILVLTLLFSVCAPALAAAGDVTANVVYDAGLGAIVVSGTVKSALSNLYVTLEFQNGEGETVYVDQLLLPYDEAAEKPYSFPAVTLHPKNKTGNYTILVTAEDVGAAVPQTYYFQGSDVQLAGLQAVSAAISLPEEDATRDDKLKEALLTKGENLGISTKAFEDMGEKAQEAVLAVMLKNTYTVPENDSTDENIDAIMASVLQLRADWQKALAVGEFYNITSTAMLQEWLKANGSAFSADDAETAVDEAALYAYIEDAAAESAMLRRVQASKLMYTVEEIGESLYEQALLTIIEARHYSESKQVFIDFPELFGINTSKFSGLSAGRQAEVYEEVVGNYKSYALAGTAFNDLVTEKQSSGSSSGNSGSSGNRNNQTIAGPLLGTESEASGATGETDVFPDMNEAAWATEAAVYLKNQGVITGDENGCLHPNNTVTRAEFAKMVVLATGLTPENESAGFADVSAADWYYPYVNAAKKNGLIEGDWANNFNPNAYITREDMAVILYRAYKINESLDYSLDFADSASISDYAKDAVAFLYAKGIMQGVGNDMFAPKEQATRAQAIQMLYNALR